MQVLGKVGVCASHRICHFDPMGLVLELLGHGPSVPKKLFVIGW